jgi:flagellar export protein FliJ
VPAKKGLDVVVKLRERAEDAALVRLGAAQRDAATAERALREAEGRSRRDERRRAAAGDWLLADSAQAAALRDVRAAETAVKVTIDALAESRGRFVEARGRAEALRRLSQLRADEEARAVDERERKQLDETAILRHARK